MPDPLVIGGLVKMGTSLINRFFPDPAQKAEQLQKLAELEQKGDLAELQAFVTLLQGQMEINKTEAQHKSVFVAGWRPAVGWTCAIGMFMAFVPKAVVITLLWTTQSVVMLWDCAAADACVLAKFTLPVFPDLGITDLIGLLVGMLGIGGMRSFEKTKGIETNALSQKARS